MSGQAKRIVLVCGSRDWTDVTTIKNRLRALPGWPGEWTVIEGGASGADRIAHEVAWDDGAAVTTFRANWQKHGKAAGPIRNQRMIVEGKPDIVLAFPRSETSRGTWDMISRARKAGVDVRVWAGSNYDEESPK